MGRTAPAVEVTLDSTSARSSGRLAIVALAVDTTTFRGAAVQLTAQGIVVRCDAPGGKFKVLIRGDGPVDGTLSIGAKESVGIVVRTATGVERAAQSFDPSAVRPMALTWSVAAR